MATTASPGKEVRVTGIGRSPDASSGGRPGSGQRADRGGALGARRRGMRWRGRSSAPATSARSSSSRRARARRPATCCWRWPRARGLSFYVGGDGRRDRLSARCLDGSARRLAWLEDYASVGRRDGRPARARRASARASASSTSRSPIRAPIGSCSTTSISNCRRARSSPSSARTAPARRRW